MGVKAGIVSTHRAWTSESEAWARYHLSLGFERIYVYADDGCAPALASTLAVDLTPCTQAYWASHASRGWFSEYLSGLERDAGTAQWGTPERVTQRQVLNACEAMLRASSDGIDWLLHIDDDEYFWCPGGSIREHFDGLQRAGIVHAHYWNHEAALLGEDAPAYRKRRMSFKKHWLALSPAQQDALPRLLPGSPYFVGHLSGKSAVRVRAGAVPQGVHWFHVDPMLGESRSCRPGVLHRPYKSASQFCDKHLSQGVFPTEGVEGLPRVYARAQHLCRNNDIDGLRSLYAGAVTLSEAQMDRLETEGYLLARDAPLPIDDVQG